MTRHIKFMTWMKPRTKRKKYCIYSVWKIPLERSTPQSPLQYYSYKRSPFSVGLGRHDGDSDLNGYWLVNLSWRVVTVSSSSSSSSSVFQNRYASHHSHLPIVFVSERERERVITMNLFRLAGDMTHLLSIIVLLLKIRTMKSCAGIYVYVPMFLLFCLLVLICLVTLLLRVPLFYCFLAKLFDPNRLYYL